MRLHLHDQDPAVPVEIPARDAFRRAREGTAVVDVREPFEFAAGHIPGAINVPLSALSSQHDQLGTGPLVVVCRSGSRSSHAVRYLRQLGYDAINLTGGMIAWEAARLPVETPGERAA
jgi:rhodanese-related sulfurtransferase